MAKLKFLTLPDVLILGELEDHPDGLTGDGLVEKTGYSEEEVVKSLYHLLDTPADIRRNGHKFSCIRS